MAAPGVKSFSIMAGITTGAVLFLILVGALVRMTGSGMGCPDWPQCFGQWIPPTDISQLPADYKTRFEVAGREIADFDPFKTWVEYVNRLLGVLIGFFCILTAAFGFRIRKTQPWAWRWSLAALGLVILQGGIGAYVVRTHLEEGVVTIHMVLALGVVALLLLALLAVAPPARRALPFEGRFPLRYHALLLLLLTLTQIVMGTQVREQIDRIALAQPDRSLWIGLLQGVYGIHQFSHYVLGALWLWMALRLRPAYALSARAGWMVGLMGAFLIAEAALGIVMHRFSVPAAAQPLHLLFAALLFAVEFYWVGWLWRAQLSASPSVQPLYAQKG